MLLASLFSSPHTSSNPRTALSGFSISVFLPPRLSLGRPISNIQNMVPRNPFPKAAFHRIARPAPTSNFSFTLSCPVLPALCLRLPSSWLPTSATTLPQFRVRRRSRSRRRAIVVRHTRLSFLRFRFACVASFHLDFALA